jgi:hypothetical protein
MKVLVACEFSGVVRDAFLAKGHDAFSCDILPDLAGSDRHFQCDVREKLVYPYVWDLIIAHPPCTALCVTGNRHYAGTISRMEAIEFFRLFLENPCPKICVENPVGVVSTAIRRPDQYVQPWEHGHPVTKKTGLWLKGLPLLQPSCIVTVEDQFIFSSGKKMSRWFYETSCLPQSERAAARSLTFQGIADAMAEQWG